MLHKISDIGLGVEEPEEGTRVKVVVKGTVVRLDADGELVIRADGADHYTNNCMPAQASFKVLGEYGENFKPGSIYRDADGDTFLRLVDGGWYDLRSEVERSDAYATRPLTKVVSPDA